MKVLKNNYKPEETNPINVKKVESYPRELTCESCFSEIEYEESDVRVGALGMAYLNCPCCGNENILENNEKTIKVTKDNLKFPNHFFHTSEETGAVNTFNEEYIKENIKKAITFFRENKDEFAWHTGTGNTSIFVYRYDGDETYYIVATNNYYDTYIDFENEDY